METEIMAKKKARKKSNTVSKKPRPVSAKVKKRRGLTGAELRELAKTNKPPQSWYDEYFTGLY